MNNIKWKKMYLESAIFYPTVKEFAMIQASDFDDATDDDIQSWLESNNHQDKKKLRSIMALWKARNDSRIKNLALRCANTKECTSLKEDAFHALCHLKNDTEVENFFIKHLVEDEDPHSLFRIIADTYWDE